MKEKNPFEVKSDNSKILSILEKVKRQNFMDWGEIEIAESVLNNTQKTYSDIKNHSYVNPKG
jgi:hypothetical protein